MLEDHVKSPVTRSRLRAGMVAPHVDAFVDWLHERGYTPITIDLRLRSLASWADWMCAAGHTLGGCLSTLEAFSAELGRGRVRFSRGPNDDSRVAAVLFVGFLEERGILPKPLPSRSDLDRFPILSEFRLWMHQHRGLRESTLDAYQRVVVNLLSDLGVDTTTYTAARVRDFVLRRAKPWGVWRANGIRTSVRAFLRFLGATGKCNAGLGDAIPHHAHWRLAATPRYLEPGDVERVINACVGHRVRDLRMRAIVLLLARLGLRAGDVAGLAFDDFDWNGGRIAVRGKGRRREWLPLPMDVGEAVLKYIREARPRLATTQVFLKVNAPHGPLTRATVTHVARGALKRAGIKAPINGAHVFRHSAATAMLRSGASLAAVGAVLRHRSPSTTAHYAKVDFGLLSEVAMPWPEVSPC